MSQVYEIPIDITLNVENSTVSFSFYWNYYMNLIQQLLQFSSFDVGFLPRNLGLHVKCIPVCLKVKLHN